MAHQPLALVTGASSGIGKEIALRLAHADYRVLACARREAVLQELAQQAPNIESFALDLERPQEVDALCNKINSGDRPLSVLVNNAGYSVRGMIEEVPLESVRRMYVVNVFVPCRLIQASLPAMRRAGKGLIVNISSVVGKFVWPGNGYYASSKHALEAITDAVRHEVAPFGIKVVAIRPGPIATEFGQSAAQRSQDWKGRGDPAYGPVDEKIQTFFAQATQGDQVPGPGVVADIFMQILKNPDPLPAYAVGPMTEDFLALRMQGDEVAWRNHIDEVTGLNKLKI
jgi:short-subunit dehydrogenase